MRNQGVSTMEVDPREKPHLEKWVSRPLGLFLKNYASDIMRNGYYDHEKGEEGEESWMLLELS